MTTNKFFSPLYRELIILFRINKYEIRSFCYFSSHNRITKKGISFATVLWRTSEKCFGIAPTQLHASRYFWRVESKYLSEKTLNSRYSQGSLQMSK